MCDNFLRLYGIYNLLVVLFLNQILLIDGQMKLVFLISQILSIVWLLSFCFVEVENGHYLLRWGHISYECITTYYVSISIVKNCELRLELKLIQFNNGFFLIEYSFEVSDLIFESNLSRRREACTSASDSNKNVFISVLVIEIFLRCRVEKFQLTVS